MLMLNNRDKRELKINQRRILMDSIELGIPSPEQILSWGQRRLPHGRVAGEVKNSKTVNYKKFTSLRDGLFCERIFGPMNNFVCACGKRQPRIDAKFCEKCEVEYTTNHTRRYRLGYIQLVSAATHIWFLKGRPSYLSIFLGKRKKRIIAVAYCNGYLVEQGFSRVKNSPSNLTRKHHGESIKEGLNLNTINNTVALKKIKQLSVHRKEATSTLEQALNNMNTSSEKEKENHGILPSFTEQRQDSSNPFLGKAKFNTAPMDIKVEGIPLGGDFKNQNLRESKIGLYKKQIKVYSQPSHSIKSPPISSANSDDENANIVKSIKKNISGQQGENSGNHFGARSTAAGNAHLIDEEVSSNPSPVFEYDKHQKENDRNFSSHHFSLTQIRGVHPRSYAQVQTLPFLPTFVCKHNLRNDLIDYLNAYPLKEDIPLPVYVDENRWRPLRDIHKFMAEQPLRLLEQSSQSTALEVHAHLKKSFFSSSFIENNNLKKVIGIEKAEISDSNKLDLKFSLSGERGQDNFMSSQASIKSQVNETQGELNDSSFKIKLISGSDKRLFYKKYPNLPNLYVPVLSPIKESKSIFSTKLDSDSVGRKENEQINKQKQLNSFIPLSSEDTFNSSSPDFFSDRYQPSVEKTNQHTNTNRPPQITHSRQMKKKKTRDKGIETLSSIELTAVREILSYTGGGALQYLLKCYNIHSFAAFLFYDLQDARFAYQEMLDVIGDWPNRGERKILNRICRKIYRTGRRLKIVQLFLRNQRRPEWMILSRLPVLPPDLRPILQMSETLVVASDLNNLYQRVIYRNNRYHKLRFIDFNLVTAIQRLVQDAVDRLIENGKGGSKPFYTPGGRPLKSLSDTLKGKKGRFRLNLLGKRVDFSGRSVIVVSPNLKIHECGLPREMALELFHYFLVRQFMLKKRGSTIVMAKMAIKKRSQGMWDMLRDLIYHHPVLLNRAPTLHRLGIQAFQPKLVLGSAILLHPLVCSGFNADFDGDQMGVHLPLCFQARAEAWDLLWSRNNLLSPATGQPMLVPSQDMVLGFYYMTTLPSYNYNKNSYNYNKNESQGIQNFEFSPKELTSAKFAEQEVAVQNQTNNALLTDVDFGEAKYTLHVPTSEKIQSPLQKRLVFPDYHDVITAFHQRRIRLHTPVWLKCPGTLENNGDLERPIELQISSFGKVNQIYAKHKCEIDLSSLSVMLFARTSVGRVMVNDVISLNNFSL